MELHEQIMLYLYHEKRNEFHDLYGKFGDASTDLIWEKAVELLGRKYISLEHPQHTAFFTVSTNPYPTYKPDPKPKQEDYLKGKIETDGIEYVRNNLIKKEEDPIEREVKIWGIRANKFAIGSGLLNALLLAGGTYLGYLTFLQSTEIQELKKENERIGKEKDILSQESIKLSNMKNMEVKTLKHKLDSTIIIINDLTRKPANKKE